MTIKKSKRFKPTKDMIMALMAVLTISSTSFCVMKNNEVNIKTKEITKLEQVIEDNKKELKKRDNTLNEYKENVDKMETIALEKDKVIKDQEDVIKQKDDRIKELQSQEYPTTINNGRSARLGGQTNMTLTFYGDFAHENGGYAGTDAQGNKLRAGTVASNVHPFGTQFNINGQTFTVRDRGGKNFNSSNRLDVFVPRMKGESDAQYAKRISNYGVKKVNANKI